jgi:hypothetical protein
MSEDNKPMKIVFAPGCFDSFEGTQEELDQMIAEITQMAESGELFEKSQSIDLDLDPEEIEAMIEADLNDPEGILAALASTSTRILQ